MQIRDLLTENIIVFSKPIDGHMIHLKAVLTGLKKSGRTVKPRKFCFLQNRFECLCPIVSLGVLWLMKRASRVLVLFCI